MKLQFETVEREEGANLYRVYSPCGIFKMWAKNQKQIRESMKTACYFCRTCNASDSELPTCKCWCAECKEYKQGK